MERYEGMSTVYSYEAAGGISLFSVEPPDGAISGGSGNEGSETQATRIRWWILQNEDGTFSGGITGMSWFRNVQVLGQSVDGPFDGITDEQIYEAAKDGDLSEIFGPWNSAHSGDEDITIQMYVAYLKQNGAGGCVIEGGVAN